MMMPMPMYYVHIMSGSLPINEFTFIGLGFLLIEFIVMCITFILSTIDVVDELVLYNISIFVLSSCLCIGLILLVVSCFVG